jgi:hypothetical protein
MNKYEKLGTFLVRIACVTLMAWSALRLVVFLFAALATNGFRQGSGWPLLFQSVLPGGVGLILHFVRPQIVSYLAKDLSD